MKNSKEYQDKWLSKNPGYMKEWRKKHKEEILEYHKEWARQHPGYMSKHVQASKKKKPEYYKEQKREYVRKCREQSKKIEIGGINMKFRNRGKHNFGHLRKVNRVYEYVETRISRGDTFTVQDMAKDLKIARTTCIGILQELQNTTNGELLYSRGSIVLKNIGTNGYGKVSDDNEGVKIKQLSTSYRNRELKKEKIYTYLCELAKNNEPIPCLSDMADNFTDMHRTTLGDILRLLDEEDKIIYKRGKVLAVNYRDVKSNTGKTLKYVKQEEIEKPKETEIITTEPISTTIDTNIIADSFGMSDISLSIQEENYNKAVKKVIADYITNADISTKEDVISYVEALYKITDKVKQELF